MNEKDLDRFELLSMIINSTNDGIYIFTHTGTVVFCNETAQKESEYSIKEEEVNILDLYPKLLCVRQHKITLLNGSASINEFQETFAYRKNQTCYPVSVRILFFDDQEFSYGIIIEKNITDLRNLKRQKQALENQLSESDSMKNMFIANITHELRTPVNGMKGLADVLAESDLNDDQRENLNIIRKCCDNMIGLINAVLDFTKISAGKLQLEEIPFSFRQFMKNVSAVHMTELNQKGLQLQINIGEDVPELVVGDELRLSQIMNNLLSNAIKFTAIGKIAVEVVNTYEDDQHLELFFVVRDTGIGIAKEDMDKLFLSFSQVDASITRKYGGTGLGLFITKKLIELMQGSIYVESEIGKGSTFSFSARFRKRTAVNLSLPEKRENTRLEPEVPKQISKTRENKQVKRESWSIKPMEEYAEKLMICLELRLWEKAELFAETVKHMIQETNESGKEQAFRLLLAVRKENYDLAVKELEKLKGIIE